MHSLCELIYVFVPQFWLQGFSSGSVMNNLLYFLPSRQGDFTVVPVLVGSLTPEKEGVYGEVFSRYLADPENLFVISSDFCHWGKWTFFSCVLNYFEIKNLGAIYGAF